MKGKDKQAKEQEHTAKADIPTLICVCGDHLKGEVVLKADHLRIYILRFYCLGCDKAWILREE